MGNRRQMQKNYSPVQINTEQANILRMLVANLLDISTPPELLAAGVPAYPHNRIPEMGQHRIDPKMLATVEITEGDNPTGENLRDQATALRLIYALVSENANPTPEAIEKRLFLELSKRGLEDAAHVAQSIVNRVKSYRSVPADIDPLAVAWKGWHNRQFIRQRLADAIKLVDSNEADYAVTVALLDIFREITPNVSQITETDYTTNQRETRDEVRKAYARRKAGKSRGPAYPWGNVRKLCPIIQPGHMHVWTAMTKLGKTTFASLIGRHIALNQPEYMVVMYHLETDKLDLGLREMARDMWIRPQDLLDGNVDIDEPKWAAILDGADQFLAERLGEGTYSKYKYVHCPGLTIQALERDIYKQKAIADAMGFEGVVAIIDYYQIMDYAKSVGIDDPVNGRNELANQLKNMFTALNTDPSGQSKVQVFGIVFAQDSVTDAGRSVPFGGTMIVQRCQAHFQIHGMMEAADNLPVNKTDKDRNAIPVDPNDRSKGWVQATDGLGNPLFWHQVGGVHSQRVIQLVRGNGVQPGFAYVQMVNGYFAVIEQENEPNWWKERQEKKRRRKKKE